MTGEANTTYSEEIVKVICDRIAEGESLNKICMDDSVKVTRKTVYNWLADEKHSSFLHRYTQARERQAETFVDQCVDIADDSSRDEIEIEGKDGKPYKKINHDHINRSRLMVDTRIKIAEKMAPTKYTPQRLVQHSGAIDLSKETEEELTNRIKSLMGEINADGV